VIEVIALLLLPTPSILCPTTSSPHLARTLTFQYDDGTLEDHAVESPWGAEIQEK